MKLPFGKKHRRDNASEDMSGENGKPEDNRDAGFAERIARFFNPEPQKEKVLRYEDFDAAGDTYYASVSAGYKIAQRIFSVIFVIFVLFSVITNIREITYDNLYFLIKDFGMAVDTESVNYETLSYDASTDQFFTLYRGGLAVVSPKNISAFTATGRRTLNSRATYSLPCAVSSDKYLLVYDTSGNSFGVYNSFSKVFSQTLDYPVTNAAFAGNGAFAVATRAADYKSVVMVYNKNFKLSAKYSKDSYLFDIAMDSEGEKIALLYFDSGDGRGRTVLTVYDTATFEEREEVVFYGEFPLSCGFLGNGYVSVVTTSALRIYDKNLSEFDSESYEGANVNAFCSGDYGCAVAVKTGALNDVNKIIAFDKSGKMIYNETIESAVSEISLCDNFIFLNSGSGVVRLNAQNGVEEELECQNGKMLVYSKDTVLVCAESKAGYLKFGS